MGHDYKLKYDLTVIAGHFSADYLKRANAGGTDGLVVISCIEAEDGGYSQTHISKDGNNEGQPMSTIQEYKAWMMMGASLQRRKDLRKDHAKILDKMLEMQRKALGL